MPNANWIKNYISPGGSRLQRFLMLDSIKRLLPETKSIVFSLFPWRNHAPFVADARNRHPPLNFIKKKILKIVPPREHDCVAKKKCRASYKPRNSCVVDLPVKDYLIVCHIALLDLLQAKITTLKMAETLSLSPIYGRALQLDYYQS